MRGELLGCAQRREWTSHGRLAEGSEMGVDGAAWAVTGCVHWLEAAMGALELAQSKPYGSWEFSCGLLCCAAIA